MAGIQSAEILVNDNLKRARVLGQGSFISSNQKFNYYVLMLCNQYWEEEETYLQITYSGGDVQFNEEVEVNDFVKLRILDEYTAGWFKVDKESDKVMGNLAGK